METMINMREIKSNIAYIIGNAGLGDSITLIGMANYLATKYKYVFFVTSNDKYENVKLFFDNPKIIVYRYDEKKTNMFEFEVMMRQFANKYDIYALGHFGNIKLDKNNKYIKMIPDGRIKKIITNYPKSYYEDVNMPISIMTDYFSVSYNDDTLEKYTDLLNNEPIYRVVHHVGSNAQANMISMFDINIEEMLTIDVNTNLYPKEHKYYKICQKFINLPKITNYEKLLENASEIYVMDSCIHALALLVNINKAYPRICLKRTPQFNYGIQNKFVYYMTYMEHK